MRRAAAVALLATAALIGPTALPAGAEASTTGADEPVFLGWSAALPPLAGTHGASTAQECRAGKPSCVTKTLRLMDRHLDGLARSCHHDSVFALAYLRTTEAYRDAAAEPGFFTDVAHLHHEDAVFAAYYFQAYADWTGGRRDAVPGAWQVAFGAAEDRRVNGSGNVLLGMNAHINRDLPYVLASIGLVAPDGSSRKPDHDKVNVFLNRVIVPLIAEEAARFDPTMDDTDTPYGLSHTAVMAAITGWREQAWRNAERLTAAPDQAGRDLVARDIEAYATTTAQAILAARSYPPVASGVDTRDAYCAAHG